MLSTLKNHSILYVEDEPEIQANIAEYLANYFADIYLAEDGKKALEKYNKHRPGVVLLDINLPIVDGLSVAKEIRKQDKSVKIIMLTAFTEKEKLLKATELKLTKYLVKPVPPKVFKETLESLAQELEQNPACFFNLKEGYSWNKEKENLVLNDTVINLGDKEHRLLKLFITNKNKTISYEKIITELWENTYEREISFDSVKNQVSKLRKKLPKDSIVSVYGEGYILK